MNIKKIFAVREHSPATDIAILLVRLVMGIAFMLHGWSKIKNPFGWMGEKAFAPPVFQALAAVSEFGGGIALILGLLMPLFVFGIACTMAVAVYSHAIKRGDPFVAKKGGPAYELAATYFCITVLLLTTGPGRFSLDRVIFGKR